MLPQSELDLSPTEGCLLSQVDGTPGKLTHLGQGASMPAAGISGSYPHGSWQPEPLRALVVDDHDDILTMMHLLMTRRNYRVATASSAEEALEIAVSFEPHVVISDIAMPDVDGYEMMRLMRSGPHGTRFKAVALTGYGHQADLTAATECGYDAHLTKPVDFQLLFTTIEELVPDPALKR